MTFPGGGVWKVSKGQITDDSEMALCLMHAINKADDESKLTDLTSRMYRAWYASKPFDLGRTTRNAVSAAGNDASSMISQALGRNPDSQSNGCLMRIMPIVMAAQKFGWNAERLERFVRADVSLTHGHAAPADAVLTYVVALLALIRSDGDAQLARQLAERCAASTASARELQTWLQEADSDGQVRVLASMGWIKHAFVLSFRALHRNWDWNQAVRQTVILNGDTDTNACIVGGMIGARYSLHGVPEYALSAVSECMPNHGRPDWLRPQNWLSKDIDPL